MCIRDRSIVFEQSLKNRTIRRTIGSVSAWSVDEARAEAKRLSVLIDVGTDPRELARQEAEAAANAVTVATVWPRYLAEGKPKRRAAWKPRYVADLKAAASLGGEPKKRGKGTTRPGHLAALMPLRLASIDCLLYTSRCV